MDAATITATAVTTVSAIIALAALYFTRQQVRLAERQTVLQEKVREDQAQPYVWADLRPDDRQMHLMRLLVCNEGPTIATKVSVTFDPPLPTVLGSERGEREVFRLAGMPPGRRMSWTLNTAPDWINGELAKRFTVMVAATGPYGPVGPVVYELDVDEYRQTNAAPAGSLHGINKAITDLTNALKRQPG